MLAVNLENQRLLTPQEVAELLQVKVPTLREWVRAKRLRAVKVGRLLRFRSADVEAFLERHTTTGRR